MKPRRRTGDRDAIVLRDVPGTDARLGDLVVIAGADECVVKSQSTEAAERLRRSPFLRTVEPEPTTRLEWAAGHDAMLGADEWTVQLRENMPELGLLEGDAMRRRRDRLLLVRRLPLRTLELLDATRLWFSVRVPEVAQPRLRLLP